MNKGELSIATRQSQKVEPPKVIGAISKFAGALVGTAVVTGRRIAKTAAQAVEGPSAKPEERSMRAPGEKRKKQKTAVKTKAKSRKVKKKSTGPGRKSKTPRKGRAQSPAKKRKRQAAIS